MKPIVVVDTNVAVAANRKADASPGCVRACVNELLAITGDAKRVALDLEGLIIREYMNNLSLAGQPGVGDAFMKWLHTNQAVVDRVEKVAITQPVASNGGDSFPEFPDDDALAGFDPSDRKFVAVARVHPEAPAILQATDTKWWGWREGLRRHGVVVEFLCEADIRADYEKKFERRGRGGRRA